MAIQKQNMNKLKLITPKYSLQ